ncbi:MAG: M16 family metallopeptidase [Longimicrobiales bacterium]
MQLQLPHSRFTLPNGLQLIVHEDHAVPIVAVNIWYGVGSKDERHGRTGLAHLFEHLMFEGSANVPEGQFDELLESAGGVNNGSTSTDRTNYWETVPTGALELALFLEADRMGGLLDALTQDKLDAQRNVVKNERRQSYENRPYGLAFETIHKSLYPVDHPYHWPVIGWMPDLDAATLDDVQAFFRCHYAPGNASLCVAGDVESERVLELTHEYFSAIPPAGATPPVRVSTLRPPQEQPLTLEDDVHLPRLYLSWHTPALFAPDDAALDVFGLVLSQGKSSRLYRTLVYERQLAQNVEAFQASALLGSTFNIVVTARPTTDLAQLVLLVRQELERAGAQLEADQIDRARHKFETSFVDSLQQVGGFGGRADRLNHYAYYLGEPGALAHDLERYQRLDADAVAQAARTHLLRAAPLVLSVVPRGEAARAVHEAW